MKISSSLADCRMRVRRTLTFPTAFITSGCLSPFFRFAVLLLAGILTCGVICSAQVLYVAPGGSDTVGDGSAQAPFASITAAVQALPESGGKVVVRDGVYTGRVRINRKFRNWVEIRAENAYRAKLQAAHETVLHIYDAAFVEVSGFEITRTAPETTAPLAAQISRSENIILRDNIFHDSQNNDVLKVNEAPRNILIIGNLFYNAEGGAGSHIDLNGVTGGYVYDNIFFNDFEGSGKKDPEDTASFIVIKNSGNVPESRRFHIAGNIMLNWQGSLGRNFILLGEDGKPFHETQDVLIENNLLIGNSPKRMRSSFGAKGVRDVVFRNNTIAGDLPASAYAMRVNREGANPVNRNLRFYNNIWSDPTGTMGNFSDGQPSESTALELLNNLYWNGGQPLPGGQFISPADDPRAENQDPLLGAQQEVVLPRWMEGKFRSGASTIREEFQRLVRLYGTPDAASPARDRSLPDQSPATDILGRQRTGSPDLGAVEIDAEAAPLRVLLVPERIAGGLKTHLNQVVLEQPAGEEGVTVRLVSADPELVQAPESVRIEAGRRSATFALASREVQEPVGVALTAILGDFRRTVKLEMIPGGVSSLNLSPESVIGGTGSDRNLVLIDGVAPAEGLQVSLSTSHPDLVSLPEKVSIPAGRSYSDYFPIRTRFTPETTSVKLTATLDSRSASENLQLTSQPFSLYLPWTSLVANASVPRNRVYIDRAAPAEGAVVQFTSSNPDLLKVPEQLRIPEGDNVGEFTVETGSPDTRSRVTLTATFDGRSVSVPVEVSPVAIKYITGPTALAGGTAGTFRVVMNTATGAEGVKVRVTVSGVEAEAPEEVFIPGGANFASFQVKAGLVQEATAMIIQVARNENSVQHRVMVQPPKLRTFTVPSLLRSGSSGTAILYATGPAPPGGLIVNLSSSDPSVLPVPESITIPTGESSVRFNLRAGVFSSTQEVMLRAAAGEVSVERAITISPAEISRVSVSPGTVTGGANLTITILFSGQYPGNTVLRAASSMPEVIAVPESITVPDGAGSARIIVRSSPVSEQVKVVLTFSDGTVSKTAEVTVRP